MPQVKILSILMCGVKETRLRKSIKVHTHLNLSDVIKFESIEYEN
jgi:hypothetical protein